MARFLRLLLVVLLAFAASGAAAHPAARMAHPAMASMPGCSATSRGTPAPGMTVDCNDRACCVAGAVLPERFATQRPVVHAHLVAYWPAGLPLAGIASAPEPLPPRTA